MPVEFSHALQIVSIQRCILFKVYRNLIECFKCLASKTLGKKWLKLILLVEVGNKYF